MAVCKNCPSAKKVRAGLKRHFKDAGRCDVRVVAVSCLDICPKRGSVVATGSAAGLRVVVAGKGTAACDIARSVLEEPREGG